ncbi:MAG: Flp family type IVb pilin [Chloroflexota bacterium]
MLRRLLVEESGATMVEYAIMAASIAGVCIVIVQALGGQVQLLFETLRAQF